MSIAAAEAPDARSAREPTTAVSPDEAGKRVRADKRHPKPHKPANIQ